MYICSPYPLMLNNITIFYLSFLFKTKIKNKLQENKTVLGKADESPSSFHVTGIPGNDTEHHHEIMAHSFHTGHAVVLITCVTNT